MDDGKIIDMFFARNEDAIRHTDAAYGRRLYHLADRIVENGQDAEESVSDTYLKAWNTIPPKRPEHFFAYIAKICRNFALKKVVWKNAQKRKAEVVTLTPDNQMVFLRRYWYVDTIAEIAARYGISESAVQMRLNRTKQKLSAYLAKEGIRV